jgi:hypothetical protein
VIVEPFVSFEHTYLDGHGLDRWFDERIVEHDDAIRVGGKRGIGRQKLYAGWKKVVQLHVRSG